MSALSITETTLVVVEAVASATLMIRFLLAGLHQVYRFFFIYLVLFAVQLSGPFIIKPRTDAYAYFFFATEAVIVFLYILVALELYSLVLRDLKGIATVARRYIRASIALSILFSLVLLGIEETRKDNLSRFFSVERPIVSSLIIFVLLITGFLFYYPIPLNTNVIYYTIGYAVFFSSKAIVLLVSNRGQSWNRVLSVVMLAISSGCLIFWSLVLTRAGQNKPKVSGPKWSKDEENRLLNKLTQLNANLLQAGRKIPR